ncbi:hypothetical protein OPV22_029486 [Ensete ventricosum]|uniref:Uncharacterized protein n=1 Tax=Ensete ventricosum TaxID=4639 RepID=A0AAV8Q610_ENSVE|nr:hypothetical protein OPV22_029486 [Ensete ventricosum]
MMLVSLSTGTEFRKDAWICGVEEALAVLDDGLVAEAHWASDFFAILTATFRDRTRSSVLERLRREAEAGTRKESVHPSSRLTFNFVLEGRTRYERRRIPFITGNAHP